MADEDDLALSEAPDETLDAPEPDEAPLSPVEEIAAKIGWSPKDKWQGEPDKWRPADEFIIAGRDIQQSSARELRAMREQMERLNGVTETIVRDKVAEAREQWEARLAQAVDDGDLAAVKLAGEQLAKVDTPRRDGPDPTAAAWVARNEWFNTDPLAQMRAKEVAERLAKQGMGVKDQLDGAERIVRKEFPELFPAPAKPAPGVQTGTGRPSNPTNRIKGFAHMPDEAQKMALDYKERHGVPTEDFAKRYWANRGATK